MSSHPPYRGGDANGDLFATGLLLVGAVVVVVNWLAWLAGHLVLFLAGHGWVQAPLRDTAGFLLALVRTGDPTAAWATAFPESPRLVDVGLFWTIAALLLTAVSTAVAGTVMLWRDRMGVPRGGRSTPARWATRRHERRIAVADHPDQRRWRLVAGRSRTTRRLLAGQDCVSAVVFGPNGSGKTTSLIVPNVLDWDGPVVLTTAKPQDLEPICTARAEHGPVWVVAPGGAPGHETTGWSPVAATVDAETADRVAEWLVDSSGMTGDPKSRPWNAQARKYLKGLLLAAHHAIKPVDQADTDAADGEPDQVSGLGQWVEWLYAGERARDQVEDILRRHGEHQTAVEYGSTWQIHDEGKGSVLFTALGLADTYSRPGVLTAAQTGGFDVEEFLNTAGTLCVVTPSGEGDRFAPYFTTLLTAIIHAAETRAATTSRPLEPRLLLALDEAGNVFRYPRLPQLLTTSRGNGIQLLLVYHDLAQIEHLYGGRQVARTVLSNAKLRLLLPGVGDLDTLRYWSDLLGRTRTQTHGETTGHDGHRSRTRNEHIDDLAPLHVLQQLPSGQAVLVYENLPPMRIRLLPWYRDRRYRHMSPTRQARAA